MEQQEHNLWQKIRIHKTKLIIAILAILIMAAAAYIPSVIARGAARRVLTHAKSVRLATQITYYDYFASGEVFFEDDGIGVKPDGEKKILELAQCEGTIYQVRFDDESFRVSRLIYREGEYIVDFRDTGDNPQWSVYRLEQLIQ